MNGRDERERLRRGVSCRLIECLKGRQRGEESGVLTVVGDFLPHGLNRMALTAWLSPLWLERNWTEGVPSSSLETCQN